MVVLLRAKLMAEVVISAGFADLQTLSNSLASLTIFSLTFLAKNKSSVESKTKQIFSLFIKFGNKILYLSIG